MIDKYVLADTSNSRAANYVSESVKGSTSTASKEANKNVAKDSNVPISTRAEAATDMVGDKIDEQAHNVSLCPERRTGHC
jgi:hypothetical protein